MPGSRAVYNNYALRRIRERPVRRNALRSRRSSRRRRRTRPSSRRSRLTFRARSSTNARVRGSIRRSPRAIHHKLVRRRALTRPELRFNRLRDDRSRRRNTAALTRFLGHPGPRRKNPKRKSPLPPRKPAPKKPRLPPGLGLPGPTSFIPWQGSGRF